MSTLRRTILAVFWGLLAWLVSAGLLMLVLWPAVPHTATGWLLLLGLATPLFMLGSIVNFRSHIRPSRIGAAAAGQHAENQTR